MAIGTDDTILKFGTQTEVISIAGTAVIDGSWSDSGDYTAWTNSDDVPLASFVLDATMSGNPTRGTAVDLYARLQNISDTTQDANEPTDAFKFHYVCSFFMDDGTTAQLAATGPVKLPLLVSSQEIHFYVENNSGVSLNTGSTVDIVPVAYGAKA